MSVTGSASSANQNVLRGKIKSLSPYAIDPTLSVEGASADAKAVGEALDKKVAYMDIVDDLTTNDSERVLSAKQGVELKKSVENLRLAANESISSLELEIGELQSNVSEAESSANAAHTAAKVAQAAVDSKVNLDGSSPMNADFDMGSNKVINLADPVVNTDGANKGYVDSRKKTAVCTLLKSAWESNEQTVDVPGVSANNTVIIAPASDSFSDYRNAGVRCTGQGKDTLSFGYEFTPTADLNVNVLILE